MAWVKEPPYIPEKESEVFYWYYDFKEQAMWPTTIYKGCWKLYAFDGLWWDNPIKPPKEPKIAKKKGKKKK
jgi:hypothetical protein